jgi:hypothetical protein
MSKRPKASPALLVAVIALVAAIAGTALAGSDPAKNHHKDEKGDRALFNKMMRERHFFGVVAQGSSNAPIATFPIPPATTLKIFGTCSGAGNPTITTRISAVTNLMYHVEGTATVPGSAFVGANAPVAMTAPGSLGGIGHLRAVTHNTRKSIELEWFIRPRNSLGANTGCFFSGYVLNS